MATIPMIPIGPVATLNRSILVTERAMSGTGGDDFICGHCGYLMLEDFDPSTVRVILSINAPFVKTIMIYLSPRVMVATGPRDDADQTQQVTKAGLRHGAASKAA
jgi:hypothetical protein